MRIIDITESMCYISRPATKVDRYIIVVRSKPMNGELAALS